MSNFFLNNIRDWCKLIILHIFLLFFSTKSLEYASVLIRKMQNIQRFWVLFSFHCTFNLYISNAIISFCREKKRSYTENYTLSTHINMVLKWNLHDRKSIQQNCVLFFYVVTTLRKLKKMLAIFS